MKRKALIIAFMLLATMLVSVIPAGAASNHVPDLYIVGISMNPPGNNQQHCFIEVYNATDKEIDLKQYKLAMQHPGSAYAPYVFFNEIRQHSAAEIAAGATEPAQSFIGPGQVAVIWVKGNNNETLQAMTREDFAGEINALNQGWGIPAANNAKIFVTNEASHAGADMSGGGDGTPFYLINSDTTNTVPDYFTFSIVEKSATAEEFHSREANNTWNSKLVSYAEISSRDARALGVFNDAIVKLKYDVAQGKSLYYKAILPTGRLITDEVALAGTENEARMELGKFIGTVDAEVKLTASSVVVTPEVTAPPASTDAPTTTKTPVTTTSPPTSDVTVYIAVAALMIVGAAVFAVSKKRKSIGA